MAQVVARLEYALERQQIIPSSISDEAISVGQPCEVENMKPPHFDQFTFPPMLEESVTVISPVEEGITPQAIQTAEVKTRGEVYPSREMDHTPVQKPSQGWPWVAFRSRGKRMKKKDLDSREIVQSSNLKKFTFAELKAATRNFRPDSLLGNGGFGSVFKGWIDEQSLAASKPGTGMVVAVKKLYQERWQGHKEWLAEINHLGQLRHPNLVKLIGYCLKDDHRLLVYEFMPNGSMENHLFMRGSYLEPLSWTLRIKIALGAARGLAFLHGAETKVIHRDIKPSNILLDSNYNAKLSNFALARDELTGDESHVTTRVMGTFGYFDPRYACTGHFTTKSNVYSFGVVLLEILTGEKIANMMYRLIDESGLMEWMDRPTDESGLLEWMDQPTDEITSLTERMKWHGPMEWAKPYLTDKRRISRVLDARLEGQYSLGPAFKLANLALQCLSVEPKSRPTMDEVVTALEQLHDSKATPNNEKRMVSQTDKVIQIVRQDLQLHHSMLE